MRWQVVDAEYVDDADERVEVRADTPDEAAEAFAKLCFESPDEGDEFDVVVFLGGVRVAAYAVTCHWSVDFDARAKP